MPQDLPHYDHYIGGESVAPASGQYLPTDDPFTGQTWAQVARGNAADAERAVEAASRAFESGAWPALTPSERGRLLWKLGDLVIANADRLAVIEQRDNGKLAIEVRAQVRYMGDYFKYYAGLADKVQSAVIPTDKKGVFAYTRYEAKGVVAIITPWNSPLTLTSWKLAPALAAGCTAVVKPAGETPLTALALGVLAERAGIPAGVLNIITGDSRAIGGVLTSHPAVKFVGFTGSTEVGKLLMQQAASTVKKVGLELGGNAPFIVFDDADLEAAVEGAIVSKFRNMGQTCVCANRIYAQEGIYDAFVTRLARRVGELKVGHGTEAGVVQGPLITMEAIDKVERHIGDAVGQGARVLVGGKRHALGRSFFEPTVLADVTPTMLVTREETFGPLAPVYRFTDEADVVAQANATEYGLAAYFYARDLGRVFRVAEALEYGMVGINTGLIATEVAPFGGVKESGIGREGSRHGMEEFTEMKYMLLGGLDR
jgi:succinate-semialdehyde dehydrogenase / glutarate-semialdehyde dehydrogenase